jgi:hypothetical protein
LYVAAVPISLEIEGAGVEGLIVGFLPVTRTVCRRDPPPTVASVNEGS